MRIGRREDTGARPVPPEHEAAGTSPDLPEIAREAAASSRRAQGRYLAVIAVALIAGIVVALAIELGPTALGVQRPIAFALVVLLLATIALQFVSSRRAVTSAWYAGRAAAESAKTASWLYMTHARPFTGAADADARLDETVAEIRDTARAIGGPPVAGRTADVSTDRMREIRAADWGLRRQAYVRWRLEDQIRWYQGRARYNLRRAKLFRRAIVGGQVLTVLGAVAYALEAALSLVGTFTTLTASIVAWAQTRRFDELGESYSLAAHELRAIHERIAAAPDEAAFVELVAESESAISREHTMWVARRLSTTAIVTRHHGG